MKDLKEVKHHKNWLVRLFNFFGCIEIQNREDFLQAISQAESHSIIDADASKMIQGVMNVSDNTVSDIMIPRSQMTVVNLNAPLSDILPIMIDSSHSRFPVVDDEDKDKVIGILHAKDVLPHLVSRHLNELKLQADMLRPAVFIPESKHLDTLLKEFRLSRNHLAVVVDEYGMTSGLVTIEDVLEEIVGEIEDEFDTEADALIKPLGPDLFEVNALTDIEVFNQHFGTHYNTERVDTVGGLILLNLGTVPTEGTVFQLGSLEIRILESDERRILRMSVHRLTHDISHEEPKGHLDSV